MGSDDLEHLVNRATQGDERAFGVLVQRFAREIYAHIRRCVSSVDDADDIVQDVFLTAYRSIAGLRDPRRFGAWLHALTRNAVMSFHRRRAVQLRLDDSLLPPDPDDDPSDDIRLTVRAALRTLSVEHRQAIAHHYFKGYSYAQTADLLDLTVDTVKGRLKRARRRLKQELLTMSNIQPQTFRLESEDLDAFNLILPFLSTDPNRPILQGICLDTGGRIVASSGHVLIIRTSPRLSTLAAPVILGPWSAPLLQNGPMSLSIGEEQAAFEGSGQSTQVPIIEGPYVQYETVMPREPPQARISLPADLLIEALDNLASHFEEAHLLAPDSEWTYTPHVELQLSNLGQTLTVLTTRDMGYNRSRANGKMESFLASGLQESPGGPIDWRVQNTLPVGVEAEPADDILRMRVNASYLRHILRALAAPGDSLWLTFHGTDRPILFSPGSHPDWLALLMPLRMEAAEAAS